MQVRLFGDVKSTAVKDQLVQWYVEGKTKIQPLVDCLKNIKLEQWAQIASIANSSSATIVSSLEIVSRLVGKSGVDEMLMRRIANERESAVNSYKQANQALLAGSHGLALMHIDNAMAEFNATPLTGTQREVWADLQLKSEMLVLKAMIHLSLNKPQAAINALKVVLSIDANALLAHNLLAHLYIHTENNSDSAKLHLKKSLSLASHQIFANYYLAKLNGSEAKMRDAMDKLVNVFSQKASLGEDVSHNSAWLSLQATTIPCMILSLLTDWLSYSVSHVNDPRALACIANMGTVLSEQPIDVLSASSERILEVRLLALNRLAKLKLFAAECESYDLEWRQSYALVEPGESNESSYFMEFSSKTITKSVTRLFDSVDLNLLKSKEFQCKMAAVIAGWAVHGWLSQDSSMQDILQCVRVLKHLTGQAREKQHQALLALCSNTKIITHFVESYILLPNPWENIYKATQHGEKLHSVLHILCAHLNVNLHAYTKKEGVLTLSESYSEMHDESVLLGGAARISKKTADIEKLPVCYNSEMNSLSILMPINTPGRVYSRIALQDAWSLHAKNPNNQVALEYLQRKGAVNLLKSEPSDDCGFVLPDDLECAFPNAQNSISKTSVPSPHGFFAWMKSDTKETAVMLSLGAVALLASSVLRQ